MPLFRALAKNMAPMTNAEESRTNRLTLFPIYLSLFIVSTLCLWDGLHQSLAQHLVLVNLSSPLHLTINFLILQTVLPEVLMLPPDPFCLSVSPRSLETSCCGQRTGA